MTPLDQLLVETDAPFLDADAVPRPAERDLPDPAHRARDGAGEGRGRGRDGRRDRRERDPGLRPVLTCGSRRAATSVRRPSTSRGELSTSGRGDSSSARPQSGAFRWTARHRRSLASATTAGIGKPRPCAPTNLLDSLREGRSRARPAAPVPGPARAGGCVHVRPGSVALHGALLAVLVAGPLAYVTAGKSVTVDVDGRRADVRTLRVARSARARRSRASHVGAHDTVAPSLSAPVTSGMQVVGAARASGPPRRRRCAPGRVDDSRRRAASSRGSLGGRYDDAYLSVSRSTRIPLSGLRARRTHAEDRDRRRTAATDRGRRHHRGDRGPTRSPAPGCRWARPADCQSPSASAPIDGQHGGVVAHRHAGR